MKQSKFYQIKNITEHEYTLVGCDGSVTTRPIQDVDKSASVFTIEDAKAGDVLYCKSDVLDCKSSGIEYIVMNKGVNKHGNIDSYFRYNSLNGFGVDIPSVFSTREDDITPATKEQRDFLFSKMKEAGYEWDAEKKELKIIDWNKHIKYEPNSPSIIEQNQSWSEEDEEMIDAVIADIQFTQRAHNHEVNQIVYEREIDWLKSLKSQNRWKPSEEQIEAFEHFVRSIGESGYASPYDNNTKLLYSLLEQLKKIKMNIIK